MYTPTRVHPRWHPRALGRGQSSRGDAHANAIEIPRGECAAREADPWRCITAHWELASYDVCFGRVIIYVELPRHTLRSYTLRRMLTATWGMDLVTKLPFCCVIAGSFCSLCSAALLWGRWRGLFQYRIRFGEIGATYMYIFLSYTSVKERNVFIGLFVAERTHTHVHA